MILIQVANDSLIINKNVLAGYSNWYIIEILLIIGVILYQLYETRIVFLNISQLKSIFKNQIKVKNGYIEKLKLNKNEKTIKDIMFEEEWNTDINIPQSKSE